MQSTPIWSILIPSSGNRIEKYCITLIKELERQIGNLDIELLVFYDNLNRTIGGKRNSLMHIARGDFISFIDDDDLISPNYISSIYEEIEKDRNLDLVTFDMKLRVLGSDPVICKHDPNVPPPGYMENGVWHGIPSHIMVWRCELVRSAAFPNKNFGEDYEWMTTVSSYVKNHKNIDKILYSYECGRSSMPDHAYALLGDPFAN